MDGAEIKLDSVNLGGWLLWESWIWGRPLDLLHLDRQSESHMLARLTELYGSDEAATFRSRLDGELVAGADLVAIAALGFNTVRLPLNHTVVDDPARLAIGPIRRTLVRRVARSRGDGPIRRTLVRRAAEARGDRRAPGGARQ